MTKIYYKNKEITEKEAKIITYLKTGSKNYQDLFFGFNDPTTKEKIYTDYESLEELGLYCHPLDGSIVKTKPSVSLKKRACYRPFSNSFNETIHQGKEKDFGVKSASHILTGGVTNTFGVEMEVCRGLVPAPIAIFNDINVHCEFDGSLRDPDGSELGSEFITGVLTGDEGLVNLQKLCNVLSDRCLVDKRCGVHVHVGVNPSPAFVVAAYKLANDIQEEMFSLVSPSRRNNDTCGLLKDHREIITDYVKKYDLYNGIKESYRFLFNEFSNARELDNKVNKKHFHPGKKYTDRYSDPKYSDIKKLYRYKIINFIPCCFNMRQKQGKISEIPYTLEFRCHQGTTSFRKIKNWILLCLAFVSFVENNSYQIILNEGNYSLFDILKSVYGTDRKIYYPLINYFKKRQELFKETTFEPENAKIAENLEYETFEKITLKKTELISI